MNRKNKEYNKNPINPQQQLLVICESFLTKKEENNSSSEIEVRFGTKGIKD